MTSDAHIAATITPHHLLLNRNDLLVGGIHPHNYCLPVLKRNTHQQALIKAATSGNPKFFLGTDSAPHAQSLKENACGCADFYGLPRNTQKITLVKESWTVPKVYPFGEHPLVPMRAGEMIKWKVMN